MILNNSNMIAANTYFQRCTSSFGCIYSFSLCNYYPFHQGKYWHSLSVLVFWCKPMKFYPQGLCSLSVQKATLERKGVFWAEACRCLLTLNSPRCWEGPCTRLSVGAPPSGGELHPASHPCRDSHYSWDVSVDKWLLFEKHFHLPTLYQCQ